MSTQTPTLADVKRLFTPGTRWAVTNHYIDRPDHPSFGTTERTVTRTTSARVYMAREGEKEREINWPKATQVAVTSTVVTFSNHPKMPGEPFLTFEKLS